ncbi:MBL fold metallo-hydrolase [Kordiimonas sp. UBA4487]|nr:MBL fold metallo-hydrolase [Kordiimonas sp. UBA4487]
MHMLGKFAAAATASLMMAATANAGEKEDALIDRVVGAYGGKALTEASAMRISDRYKILAVGQSVDPKVMDIGHNYVDLIIDFENQRKSVMAWNKNRAGNGLNQTIHDGQTGYNVDHLNQNQFENANLQYAVLGGGIMRTTDAALVRLLADGRETAVHGGEALYQGQAHEKLTFKMEGSPDLTLFINKETGLVSKMERYNPVFGTLSYLFDDHRTVDGVTYASDMNFLIDGQPNIISISRSVDMTPDLTGAFDVPTDYEARGQTVDTSEMSVLDLGDGVYFAGQNIGYSIFVDAGDHYIASGGYAGLKDRLAAVQAQAGNEKPLGKLVVTHHHSDHLGGMNEAVELGATLVTVAEHVQPIQESLNQPLADDRFELVEGQTTLLGGKIALHDISTAHAANYLLFYMPARKLVFSADHFGTPLVSGLPVANLNMVTFRQALERLGIDTQVFYSAHGGRALTLAELRAATDAYEAKGCPAGFEICAD